MFLVDDDDDSDPMDEISDLNDGGTSLSERHRKRKQTEFVLEDQELKFVTGQRGRRMLFFNGFLFALNNSVGTTKYWCCRTKTKQKTCNARLVTTKKVGESELYTIMVTQPRHNHMPTIRMIKKIERDLNAYVKYNFSMDEFSGQDLTMGENILC